MKSIFNLISALIGLMGILFYSCNTSNKNTQPQIVCTTTMITDLVKNIGADSIQVQGLMGSGVDPHLYKSTESDLSKLANANIIFYNGLHLEGKMTEVFEKMNQRTKTVALGELLPKNQLITSSNFASNHDPHIWFSIPLWKQTAKNVAKELTTINPENASYYQKNLADYLKKLDELEQNIKHKIEELPPEDRILVTAHDAFSYFGKTYGFDVKSLQGLTTVAEAGTKDVRDLANDLVKYKIKAIFVESSVPQRTVKALQANVKDQGFEVQIGGTLYSDALGNAGTKEGTYIGMFQHNVNTIVNALK